MKSNVLSGLACASVLAFSVPALTACHRHDPRDNANPHPQGALEKDKPASSGGVAPAPADPKTVGTDSTGRPGDASGGTTGADRRNSNSTESQSAPKK
jgi:hypothetical protein